MHQEQMKVYNFHIEIMLSAKTETSNKSRSNMYLDKTPYHVTPRTLETRNTAEDLHCTRQNVKQMIGQSCMKG